MPDSRWVPRREGRAQIREKASRFLAFALPVKSPEHAAAEIDRLRRQYHDATHVAFAWEVGSGDAAQRRSSDAGEPSGTAGKPIAAAIESAGLTDTLVAVVRYFGGTKLGTGGLARAYRDSAQRALTAAGRRRIHDTAVVEICCPYDSVGAVRRLLDPPEVTLIEERFGEECLFHVAVFRSRLAAFAAKLEEARLEYRVD